MKFNDLHEAVLDMNRTGIFQATHSIPFPSHITENMLTEAFIGGELKPRLVDIFKRRINAKKSAINKYNSKIAEYEQELASMGFNGKEITRIAKEKAKQLNPENFNSKFSKQMGEMIDEIKERGFRDLTIPVITVIAIIFINTAMMTLFTAATGDPLIALALGAVFVAPITEEVGRYINIKRGDGGRYNIIFNIAEFVTYIIRAPLMGITFGAMALARIIPVIDHTFWTVITRDRAMKGKTGVGAFGVSSLLHSLTNLTAAVPVMSIVTGAVLTKKDNTGDYDNKKLVAFGYSGSEDESSISSKIVVREIDHVMVDSTINPNFIRRHAKLIGATIETYDDFDEVKKKYNKKEFGKIAVILPVEQIQKGYPNTKIKRWIDNSIEREMVRPPYGA